MHEQIQTPSSAYRNRDKNTQGDGLQVRTTWNGTCGGSSRPSFSMTTRRNQRRPQGNPSSHRHCGRKPLDRKTSPSEHKMDTLCKASVRCWPTSEHWPRTESVPQTVHPKNSTCLPNRHLFNSKLLNCSEPLCSQNRAIQISIKPLYSNEIPRFSSKKFGLEPNLRSV